MFLLFVVFELHQNSKMPLTPSIACKLIYTDIVIPIPNDVKLIIALTGPILSRAIIIIVLAYS